MNIKDIKELIDLAERVGDYFDAYQLINDYLGQYHGDDFYYLKKKRWEICIKLREQLCNQLKEVYFDKGQSKLASLWNNLKKDGKITPEIDVFMERQYNMIMSGNF